MPCELRDKCLFYNSGKNSGVEVLTAEARKRMCDLGADYGWLPVDEEKKDSERCPILEEYYWRQRREVLRLE